MDDFAILGGLFAVALAAATILPAQSEAALAGLLLAKTHPPAVLVATASLGNVVGSIINWVLGTAAERLRQHRWFPIRVSSLDRASRWYRRWGWWSLFLSWVPVIGDPLTPVAGLLREPLWRFVIVVGIAKTLRYVAVAAFTLAWA